MADPAYKVIIFFCLLFVWFYLANIFMVWLVCRYVQTKQSLNIIYFGQAIAVLVGLCFGINIPKNINSIASIPLGQRELLGSVVLVLSYVIPAACSILTLKFAFPKIWQRYWEIRSSFRQR
jgi:hypothetical protein